MKLRAKNVRPRPFCVLDAVVQQFAMKKRTVSQAEYASQLLIHEISHDDSCQIYIFVAQLPAVPSQLTQTA